MATPSFQIHGFLFFNFQAQGSFMPLLLGLLWWELPRALCWLGGLNTEEPWAKTNLAWLKLLGRGESATREHFSPLGYYFLYVWLLRIRRSWSTETNYCYFWRLCLSYPSFAYKSDIWFCFYGIYLCECVCLFISVCFLYFFFVFFHPFLFLCFALV